jgi:PAS domain S-box-containing protein
VERKVGRPAAVLDEAVVKRTLGALSALLPIGIFAADSSGRLWYANQRISEAMGVGELPDGGTRLSIHPEDLLSITETWRGYSRGKRQLALRLISPNRTVKAFEGRVIPIVEGEGEVQGFVGYVSAFAGDVAHGSSSLSSARLLEALMDNSRDIVTVVDEQGRWRYSSAEAWRLLGYRSDFDPVGGILELIHPDDRERAIQWFLDVVSGSEHAADSLEARVRAPDGAWRYLETVADNLLSDPVVRGVVLHSRDVTERRQSRLELDRTMHRLTTLIANFPEAALLEDEHRNIVIANQAYADLVGFGGDAEKMTGQRVDPVFGDFPPDVMAQQIERARVAVAERRPVSGERYVAPDGRTYERDYIPIAQGSEYRGQLWLVRDVTARATAEAELEDLVAAKQEENRHLQQLDTMKAELLSAISHELRSPLTSIVSFTQLLSDGLGHDAPTDQAEYLEIIERNANRLLRLVGDLLLLDRIESPQSRSDMTLVDLPRVVTEAVRGLSRQAEERSIAVTTRVTPGPVMTGDAGRLGQLVDNLVSNAVKFSHSGGSVTVSAEAADGGWVLEVSDKGIGIPAREQELLFSRFFRATNAREQGTPGSGLGLSVAKAIVELHGGSISVFSRLGLGTTFTVRLPSAPPQVEGR